MNLPTGPDTLCFDKDEFMKVRGTRQVEGPAVPGGSGGGGDAGGRWRGSGVPTLNLTLTLTSGA